MKTISTFQFVASSLSVSVASVFLLLPFNFGRPLFAVFIGLAPLLLMSKEERTRPFKAKDILIFGAVIGGLIAVVIALNVWAPGEWGTQVEKLESFVF